MWAYGGRFPGGFVDFLVLVVASLGLIVIVSCACCGRLLRLRCWLLLWICFSGCLIAIDCLLVAVRFLFFGWILCGLNAVCCALGACG